VPQYDALHTTAFHLHREGIERIGRNLGVLRFPAEWVQPILTLQQAVDPRKRRVPIRSLNNAVRALVPDVTAVERGVATAQHSGPWLYAAGRPSTEGLRPILAAWLRAVVAPERPTEAATLWEQLSTTPLSWADDAAVRGDWASSDVAADTVAATAAIGAVPGGAYSLVPELVAAELLHRADQPDGFPGFRRCPTADGSGVELVSWPPLEHSGPGGHRWPYSYMVRLTVQTVAFQPRPVLHVHVGTRRWCRRAPSPRGRRGVTAYLLTDLPWFPELDRSRSFRRATLVRRNGQLQWRDGLRELFDVLEFARPLPDLADLTRDPLPFLTGPDEDRAVAIVHGTGGGGTHRVAPGASARDRHLLIRWISDTLADVLSPRAPLPRVGIERSKRPPAEPVQVRSRIGTVVDGDLTVETVWDTSGVRDAVRSAVIADLGLAEFPAIDSDGQTIWRTPELTVRLVARPIGALGEALPLDAAVRGRKQRVRDAVAGRRAAVEGNLGPATGRVLSLVELRGPGAFPQAGSDPKPALRLGFARTGRLTQFLTPVDDGDAGVGHRAAAAWADLRRQLVGCVEAPRAALTGIALPDPVDVVAIYMLRRNATPRSPFDRQVLPLAVWTSSDSADVLARASGMTEWLPYHQALLRLANRQTSELPNLPDAEAIAFIRQVIESIPHDRPMLLLTWTQNLRLTWSDLQNSRLRPDRLAVGDVPVGNTPQLRHVGVRTDDQDETPECYGLTADGRRTGLPTGLFRFPGTERVFASVGTKPSSASSSASPMGSHIFGRTTTSGRTVLETTKNPYNPQCVELTVATIQPGDDPVMWAALAHGLRDVSEAYDASLRLPCPLHLARTATEYAIPDAGTDTEAIDDDEVQDL
jgi:hypothetical protein